MSKITQRGSFEGLDVYKTGDGIALGVRVGERFDLDDEREVVLVQNAGTALVAGNLIQGPADIANHIGLTTTAYSAATTSAKATVTVTLGNTAVTTNQYQGGYLIVATGTGIGQTMKIFTHPSASASASLVVTLEDAPPVALVAASSTVSMFMNPYGSLYGTDYRTDGVIIYPHAATTGRIIGVSFYAIGASTATVPSYGFIQTRGNVACLNDANTTIGLDLMPSSNTDGAVMTYAAGSGARVGTATQAGTTTRASLITVQL